MSEDILKEMSIVMSKNMSENMSEDTSEDISKREVRNMLDKNARRYVRRNIR